MATILCPTRGGMSSYPTQDQAISLAKERGDELVFVYVSDVRFMFKGTGALIGGYEEELDEMGEFLLAMAQERASASGVEAKVDVGHGSFREAIGTLIREYDAATVVLGAPGKQEQMTTQEYLQELAEYLVREFKVEIVLIEDGEIQWHMTP